MKNLNFGNLKNIVGQICGAILCEILIVASSKAVEYINDGYIRKVGYDEAIDAIMKSDMYSHEKCDAAAVLKRNEDAEFYRAVIHIIKDSKLYSHDKVCMIKNLNKN